MSNEGLSTPTEQGQMSDFRHVTDEFSTAPQISVADVAEAARQGFKTIINNRPDGEDPSQPASAEIEAAARAAGLAYAYVPVRGGPGPAEVEAVKAAFDSSEGPVLAFCRSGTRSIVTWSIGQATSGAMSRGELTALGRQAGYDLSGVLAG
jgi:uncharacterized protein (TIGR01244 family)